MLQEFVTEDGEVISKDENNFYHKVFNNIPFEEITSYFIQKNLFEKIKARQKETNGKCGISVIELSNIIQLQQIQLSLTQLEEKNKITERIGINNKLYFLK
jgi:hypothetical protein